jgi:hypothetical protein
MWLLFASRSILVLGLASLLSGGYLWLYFWMFSDCSLDGF